MDNFINKKYFKYLVDSNRRFLGLIWMFGFIIIPFTSFIISNDINWQTTSTNILATYLGFAFSFIVPIFLFRFLYKKNSIDLYFSLPIKKHILFKTTVAFSYFATILPIFIYYLASVFIAAIRFPNQVIIKSIIFILLLIFIMLVIQAVIFYGCTVTNNLLDAIVVNASYLSLPIFTYVCIHLFFYNKAELLTKGYGNYGSALNRIFVYLTLPISNLLDIQSTGFNLLYISSLLIWLLVGLSAFVVSERYFITKKADDSQSHTTHSSTYSLIIFWVTFGFLLVASSHNRFDTMYILYVIFIFLMYTIMVTFAKRRVVLSMRHVQKFILLCIVSLLISLSFNYTKGYGLVNEYVNTKNVNKINVELYNPNGNLTFLNLKKDLHSINITDKALFKDVKELHQLAVSGAGKTAVVYLIITFTYYQNSHKLYRSYEITEKKVYKKLIKKAEQLDQKTTKTALVLATG